MNCITLILAAFLAVGSQAREDQYGMFAPYPLELGKRPPPPSNLLDSTRGPVPPNLDIPSTSTNQRPPPPSMSHSRPPLPSMSHSRPPPPSMSHQRPPSQILHPERPVLPTHRPVPPTLDTPLQVPTENQKPQSPTTVSSPINNMPQSPPFMEPEYVLPTDSTQKRPENIDIESPFETIPNPPYPSAAGQNQYPSAKSTQYPRPPPTATSNKRPSPPNMEPEYVDPTYTPQKFPPSIDIDGDQGIEIIDYGNVELGTPKYPKHPPPKFDM